MVTTEFDTYRNQAEEEIALLNDEVERKERELIEI